MEAVIGELPGLRDARSTTNIPTSRSPRWPPPRSPKNLLEHGLSRGELIDVNVPAVSPEETEAGLRGSASASTRTGCCDVSTRAGSLLLDRRSAAVGLAVPGTDSTRSSTARGHAEYLDLTGRSLLKRLRTWDWEIVPAGVPAGPDPATER